MRKGLLEMGSLKGSPARRLVPHPPTPSPSLRSDCSRSALSFRELPLGYANLFAPEYKEERPGSARSLRFSGWSIAEDFLALEDRHEG